MKNSLNLKSSNWKLWICLALAIKLIFFLLKISEDRIPNALYDGTFAWQMGDTFSYIEPIENLIKNGVYYDDFRMPGYGWIYYLLRLVFGQAMSMNMLVVLQLIFSSVSVYLLALISKKILKLFYLPFFLYLISTFVSLYDHNLLTESFFASTLILVVWLYLSTFRYKFFAIGLLLTWAVFMKPVGLPVFFLFVGIIVLANYKSPRIFLKQILILVIPFLLIDGYWIYRNNKLYGGIYPLTKTLNYPDVEASYKSHLYNFISSFGGSCVYWEPGAAITFFLKPSDYIQKKVDVELPADIYTSAFNRDSLLILKDKISLLATADLTKEKQRELDSSISGSFDDYTLSIKKEKPFLYQVKSRARLLKNFYAHPGTYNLFFKPSTSLNRFQFFIKVFYSGFYLCVVLFGFIGSLWLFFTKFRNLNFLLISGLGLYFALVYPIILRMDEYRYFVPAYPFFLICGIYLCSEIWKSFKLKLKGKTE